MESTQAKLSIGSVPMHIIRSKSVGSAQVYVDFYLEGTPAQRLLAAKYGIYAIGVAVQKAYRGTYFGAFNPAMVKAGIPSIEANYDVDEEGSANHVRLQFSVKITKAAAELGKILGRMFFTPPKTDTKHPALPAFPRGTDGYAQILSSAARFYASKKAIVIIAPKAMKPDTIEKFVAKFEKTYSKPELPSPAEVGDIPLEKECSVLSIKVGGSMPVAVVIAHLISRFGNVWLEKDSITLTGERSPYAMQKVRSVLQNMTYSGTILSMYAKAASVDVVKFELKDSKAAISTVLAIGGIACGLPINRMIGMRIESLNIPAISKLVVGTVMTTPPIEEAATSAAAAAPIEEDYLDAMVAIRKVKKTMKKKAPKKKA